MLLKVGRHIRPEPNFKLIIAREEGEGRFLQGYKNEFISITHYPVTFHVRHYVFGIVFGMLTTLVAGLMPSLKAGKIDPVAILRG